MKTIPSWARLLVGWLCLPFWAFSAADNAGQHFLWEIKQGRATVHLLGSVHLLRASDHPFPPLFGELFSKADRVVFEVRFEDFATAHFERYLQRKALYPAGEFIYDHVSAETYALLEQFRRDTGELLDDRLRPWFLVFAFPDRSAEAAQFLPELGVDLVFYRQAINQRKRIEALETVESQIEVLAGLPALRQEELLRDALLNRSVLWLWKDLIHHWKTGNTYRMAQVLEKDRQRNPVYYDRLMTRRNHEWIPQVEQYLRDDAHTLIIAGAGHFTGTNGVVQLLRNKGYTVRQLPQIPTRLRPPQWTDAGGWVLDAEVIPGRDYLLQDSADLRDWFPRFSIYSSNSVIRLNDRDASFAPQRFFRLHLLE